jgi:hypothetical protein
MVGSAIMAGVPIQLHHNKELPNRRSASICTQQKMLLLNRRWPPPSIVIVLLPPALLPHSHPQSIVSPTPPNVRTFSSVSVKVLVRRRLFVPKTNGMANPVRRWTPSAAMAGHLLPSTSLAALQSPQPNLASKSLPLPSSTRPRPASSSLMLYSTKKNQPQCYHHFTGSSISDCRGIGLFWSRWQLRRPVLSEADGFAA